MKVSILRWFAFLLILSAAIAYGIWADPLYLGLNQKHLEPRVQLSSAIRDQYRRTLDESSNQTFTYEEKGLAALELARAGDPTAEKFAFQAAESNQPSLREISAGVLGHFTSYKALRTIRHLIEDADPQISERAISSLCEVHGPARVRILDQIVNGPMTSMRHSLAARGCRYRFATQIKGPKSREAIEALRVFGEAARQPDGGEKARLALSYLVFLAPSEPETLLTSKEIIDTISAQSDPVLISTAFRHLSSHPSMKKNASLAQKSIQLVHHQDPAVRAAALTSFAFTCPSLEERQKAIESILEHENQLIVRQTAWAILSQLDKGTAKSLLNRVRHRAGANEAEQVESLVKVLNDPNHQAACQN